VAPVACALANLVAVIVMAIVLAPGTPIVADLPVRELYIGDHLLAWRLGWATWMIAAATLLWYYAWWRARVKGPQRAITIASIGIAFDWAAEIALIVAGADGYAAIAPLAFFFTGAIANGLYTYAGIQLTFATPLGPGARAYAGLMWAGGALVSFAGLVSFPLLTAIGTALLFALFIPWCVWSWRRFG
jgi:hypothetical protein